MTLSESSGICRALGDENRLRIIQMLSGGEMCACRILNALDITQPTLSHHMKILSDCNLVITRREGKWSYYSNNCGTLSEFKNMIAALFCGRKTEEL